MNKKLLFVVFVAAFATALVAFTKTDTNITGKITPSDGAESVWLISGADSMRGMLNAGNFSFTVGKPGTFKILVHAKSPYKDVFVENVEVKEGVPVDIGEIVLKK